MEQITDDFVSATGGKVNESETSDTSKPKDISAPSNEEGESIVESETTENQDLETKEGDDSPEGEQGTGDKEEQTKPRKKGGFEKRIERFQKQLSAKDQELAALRAQLESKSQGKPAEESTTKQAKSDDGEPNQDDFETVGEYARAVAKWELKQEREAAAKEREQEKLMESRQKLQSNYDAKLSEFKKQTADFDDVVADFVEEHGGFNASPAIIEALQTSDLGPQVFYEVLKTPGEYSRLSQMSEAAIIRELGKIEARLSKAPETNQSKPTTTKAPAPVKPVSGGSTNTRKSINDMSVDEYVEYMNAKTRRK